MNKPLIWGHRGANALCPENTMESFQKAIELKADGIELDVQFSKDFELVVIHDEKIDRTAQVGSGYVKDFTLKELKEFNVGDSNKGIPNAQIPTLEEVLELIAPTNLSLNVEFKTSLIEYEGIEERVLELIQKYGMEERTIYSSFNYMTVINTHRLDPTAKTAFLFWDTQEDMFAYTRKCHIDALHPDIPYLFQESFVSQLEKNPMELNVWTVNEVEQIHRCVVLGVHAIITDDILTVRKVLETYE